MSAVGALLLNNAAKAGDRTAWLDIFHDYQLMGTNTALRYVDMLGNLRTPIRNITGNLTMGGVRSIHNAVATGIEAAANKLSGGKVERTRSLAVNKAQMAAGKKDLGTIQLIPREITFVKNFIQIICNFC